MKNSKLLALMMAVSSIVTMSIFSVSANAEDPTISEGLDFVLVDNGETEKIIDVYYEGDVFADEILTISGKFRLADSEGAEITTTSAEYTAVISDSYIDIGTGDNESALTITKNAKGRFAITSTGTTNHAVPSDKKLFTIKLSVPSTIGDFKVVVYEASLSRKDDVTVKYSYKEGNSTSKLDGETLTIPAFATTPEGPTTVAFVSDDAEAVMNGDKKYFDDVTTTVPVAAWKAEINYSEYHVADTLAWEVTANGEKRTVKVPEGTTISGGTTVVYGFAVAGRADELDTITGVKLVAATTID